MTEDMIELRAERMMDALDRRYTAGELSDEEYAAEVRDIHEWCKERYSNLLEDLKEGY